MYSYTIRIVTSYIYTCMYGVVRYIIYIFIQFLPLLLSVGYIYVCNIIIHKTDKNKVINSCYISPSTWTIRHLEMC